MTASAEGIEGTRGPGREGDGLVRARVVAPLPNAMFRVATDDGEELTAHVAGDLRMKATRLLPGDAVLVKCSPLDRTKARICGFASPPRS